MIKCAINLGDNLLEPKTATSQEPHNSTFNKTFGCASPFEFYEKPENEYRWQRFSASTREGNKLAQRLGGGFAWH
jgi:hypothetical protein